VRIGPADRQFSRHGHPGGFGDTYIAGGCGKLEQRAVPDGSPKVPFSLAPNAFITKEVALHRRRTPPWESWRRSCEEWASPGRSSDVIGLRSQPCHQSYRGRVISRTRSFPSRSPAKGESRRFRPGRASPATTRELAAQTRLQEGRTVTAGSSSGMNDGAWPSCSWRRERANPWTQAPGPFRNLRPGRRGPKYMGNRTGLCHSEGPGPAGLKLSDMEIVECNVGLLPPRPWPS
jgi:hypothetical protein